VRESPFDRVVASFDVTQFAHTLRKTVIGLCTGRCGTRSRGKKTDAIEFALGLRKPGERRG